MQALCNNVLTESTGTDNAWATLGDNYTNSEADFPLLILSGLKWPSSPFQSIHNPAITGGEGSRISNQWHELMSCLFLIWSLLCSRRNSTKSQVWILKVCSVLLWPGWARWLKDNCVCVCVKSVIPSCASVRIRPKTSHDRNYSTIKKEIQHNGKGELENTPAHCSWNSLKVLA